MTDDLTRLGNRRRLFRDLEGALERGDATRLALFDLNGFKAAQRHPGPRRRRRRAARPRRAPATPRSTARAPPTASAATSSASCSTADADGVRRACAALESSEHVTASTGSVLLPVEAIEATAALRLADARMYAHKTRN